MYLLKWWCIVSVSIISLPQWHINFEIYLVSEWWHSEFNLRHGIFAVTTSKKDVTYFFNSGVSHEPLLSLLKYGIDSRTQCGSNKGLYLIVGGIDFEFFKNKNKWRFYPTLAFLGGVPTPSPHFLPNWPIFSVHIFLERSRPWLHAPCKNYIFRPLGSTQY